MKTKCALIIYNKQILYVCFKCYNFIFGEFKLISIACNSIEQWKLLYEQTIT